jgi:chromosome segregation ATPase
MTVQQQHFVQQQQQERAAHQQQLQGYQVRLGDLQAQLQQLQQQLQHEKAISKQLQARLQVKEQKPQQQPLLPPQPQPLPLDEQVLLRERELQKQLSQLQEQLQVEQSNNQTLQRQLSEAQAKISSNGNNSTSVALQMRELAAQIAVREKEKEAVEVEKRQLLKDIQTLNKDYESRITALLGEKEAIVRQWNMEKEAHAQTEKRVQDEQKLVEVEKSINKHLEGNNASLQQQLSEMRLLNQQLMSYGADTSQLWAQLEQKEAAKTSAEALCRQLQQDIEQQSKHFEERYSAAIADKDSAHRECASEKEHHRETQSLLDQERKNLEIEQEIVRNLQQQIKELSARCEQELSAKEQAHLVIKKLQRELSSLMRRTQQQQQSLMSLSPSQYHSLQPIATPPTTSGTSDVQQLQLQHQQHIHSLQQQQLVIIQQLEQEKRSVENRNQQLQNELVSLKKECLEANNTVRKLQEQLNHQSEESHAIGLVASQPPQTQEGMLLNKATTLDT